MVPTQRFLENPVRILYRDSSYVIFDKPAGLLVIPTPKKETRTLVNIVNHQVADKENLGRLHPCHRLDRDTSGTILFAWGKKNQQRMMQVFKEGRVTKEYFAFVHGKLKKESGEIKSYITHKEAQKHKRARPKLAVTQYKVIETRKHFSIVNIHLVTGRTNQIRIHFKEIGHPLVGERKYAFARDYAVKFRRPALHAQKIAFVHPQTNKRVAAEAPLPKDMREFLKSH